MRSLKMHGGVLVKDLNSGENVEAVKAGFANLQKHIENMQQYGVPVVVALNEFTNDTAAEIEAVVGLCAAQDVDCIQTAVWAKGAEGGEALANAVVKAIDENTEAFLPLYVAEDSGIEEKIETIVTKIYGGKSVIYSKEAKNQLRQYKKNGWDRLPRYVWQKHSIPCQMIRKRSAVRENFDITIRSFVPKIGAGFVVALTGDILTMPGLPKEPRTALLHGRHRRRCRYRLVLIS